MLNAIKFRNEKIEIRQFISHDWKSHFPVNKLLPTCCWNYIPVTNHERDHWNVQNMLIQTVLRLSFRKTHQIWKFI